VRNLNVQRRRITMSPVSSRGSVARRVGSVVAILVTASAQRVLRLCGAALEVAPSRGSAGSRPVSARSTLGRFTTRELDEKGRDGVVVGLARPAAVRSGERADGRKPTGR